MRARLAVLLPALYIAGAAAGQNPDKASYDITPDCGEQVACKAAGDGFPAGTPAAVRWEGAALSVTLAEDGSFTVGTTAGASDDVLDDGADVTFGYPYAVTSFPYVVVQGNAVRLSGAGVRGGGRIAASDAALEARGDTLELRRTLDAELQAVFRAIGRPDGGLHLELIVRNRSMQGDYEIVPGFMIDPALGAWGDAHADFSEVGSQVLLAPDIPDQVELTERSAAPFGLRASLGFGGEVPARLEWGNWFDLMGLRPASEAIYDAALAAEWEAVTLGPGDSTRYAVDVVLPAPDFPDGLFARVDMPRSLALYGSRLFPQDFRPRVEITNASAFESGPVTLAIEADAPLMIAAPELAPVLEPGERILVLADGSVPELYEDTALSLALTVSDGQQTDRIERTLFVPGVPLSDEGIDVRIDSLITSGFPEVGVIFDALLAGTEAKVTGLRPSNIFFYENGDRVRDFELGADTTGGVEAVDIVFVLDVTGSMADEIEAVRSNVVEFADSIRVRGIDPRLGMVTFRDVLEDVFDLSDDVDAFQDFTRAQFADGGGDAPENSLEALQRAAQMSFRPEALRVVIWITDERYHEADSVTPLVRSEVLNQLLGQGMVVHAVGPTRYVTDWYAPIIEPTGGLFFDIGGNFRDILLAISRFGPPPRYLLTYRSAQDTPDQVVVTVEVHRSGLGGSATREAASGKRTPQVAILDDGGALAGWPNPFRGQATLAWDAHGDVRIQIFDLLGRRVRSLHGSGGRYAWDGTDDAGRPLPAGSYIVRAEGPSSTSQLILTRIR